MWVATTPEHSDEAQAEVKMSDIQFKQFTTKEEADEFTDTDKIWSGVFETNGSHWRAYCRAGELGVKSIREAGKALGLNVLLDAE